MNKPYYVSFFQRGSKVYIREVCSDKSRRNYHVDYKPKIYVKSDEPNTEYKSLNGDELLEIEFSDIKSAKDYISAYQGEVFGYPRNLYACVDELYPYDIEYDFNDLRIGFVDIEVESDTHYSTIANPDQPIILIQLLYKGTYYIFGTDFYESYDNNVKYIRCKNEIDLLKKFVQVFAKFDFDIISGYNSAFYDIPMIYSRMKLLELDDNFKKLSPFNYIDTSEVEVFGKMQLRVEICGIQHLDYIDLVKKFDFTNYVNYKLDTVARTILGEGKVQFDGNLSELYVKDFSKFLEYGKKDVELLQSIEHKQKLIELVVMLGYKSKVNYVDSMMQVRMWDNAFMVFLKYQRKIQVPYKIAKDDDGLGYEGAYVKQPLAGKYNWVMSDDVASLYPSIIMAYNMSPETYYDKLDKDVKFFVDKFDVKFTRDLIDDNLTCAANGARFTRDVIGFVPEIIQIGFNKRIDAKTAMNDAKSKIAKLEIRLKEEPQNELEIQIELNIQNQIVSVKSIEQQALKISLNSAYGAIGNVNFRFYQKEIAEGITLTGQVLLKRIEKSSNEILNKLENTVGNGYVITQDTDSNYIRLDSIVNKFVPKGTPPEQIVEFLDRFHKKNIAPVLEETTNKMQSDMNVFEYKLKFIRDVIADVGIFLAKKRYILQVWDVEGNRYIKPKLKVMGIESIKSSTPEFCKSRINNSINIMLNNTNEELIDYLGVVKSEFMKLPVEDISSPRGINDIEKYTADSIVVDSFGDDEDEESITYKTRTPMHVKAAIFHNKLLMEYDLTKWYQPIENGDKIKYTYLKSPNPIGNNAIAFDGKLPEEFKLHKYVDYEMQYEKTFLNAIKSITTVIGWTTEVDSGLF